ncbi:MAG: peptidoglycan-associated lipoprotein Pal [Rhodoferax sp.]|uniref:peptidoglycan-associated lipoprotein Pal n=1 Tax=Rhodoferax sp. TaxID=50421 RepID=UPI002605968C|nr:peptidoglycan-associated lipoprotein Pal [Rhodoferax sp.]MDD5332519.1 peptidoglycan-associated lipoprotein Pal [Rhodoferax sp.]
MKHAVLVFCVVAMLAACASSVKLDEVPVEDKSGTPVSPAAAEGSGSAVGNSGVTPVDIGKSGQKAVAPAGPQIVYFDLDSFVIKPEFQSVIEAHARFIKADKSRKVVLEGHTDERGGREYNLALGQKRAEAVRSALGLLGVADGQLEAVSFGKEKPAVLGNDEAAMAKNRRTEISYR